MRHSFTNATVSFETPRLPGSLPTAEDKRSLQNEALQGLALDNLAKDLDEIANRAFRAAATLRTLRPMLRKRKR